MPSENEEILRINFQQNIKDVNKAFVVDKSLINNITISNET